MRGRRLGGWALRWIGPALFLAIWYASDRAQIRALLGRAHLLPLLGAAGINLALLFIKGWRWREIMKLQAIDYGFMRSVRAYTIASAIASWTPGRLGDFTKAYAVSRDRGISFGRAASSVIADRLLDAFALTLVAAAGAGFLLGPVGGTVTYCLVALAGVIAWILYRWASEAGPERASAALGKVGLSRAGRELGDAIAGLEQMTLPSGRKPAVVALVSTVSSTLLTFLQGYLVAVSLGVPVAFLRLSAGLAGASIASLLPLTISGIGIREATLAFYLGPSGISLGQVVSFSVAFLLIVSGSAALFGALAYMFWHNPSEAPAPAVAVGAGGGSERA
jgi:uncharacterized protein (TIRG00374 family)